MEAAPDDARRPGRGQGPRSEHSSTSSVATSQQSRQSRFSHAANPRPRASPAAIQTSSTPSTSTDRGAPRRSPAFRAAPRRRRRRRRCARWRVLADGRGAGAPDSTNRPAGEPPPEGAPRRAPRRHRPTTARRSCYRSPRARRRARARPPSPEEDGAAHFRRLSRGGRRDGEPHGLQYDDAALARERRVGVVRLVRRAVVREDLQRRLGERRAPPQGRRRRRGRRRSPAPSRAAPPDLRRPMRPPTVAGPAKERPRAVARGDADLRPQVSAEVETPLRVVDDADTA